MNTILFIAECRDLNKYVTSLIEEAGGKKKRPTLKDKRLDAAKSVGDIFTKLAGAEQELEGHLKKAATHRIYNDEIKQIEDKLKHIKAVKSALHLAHTNVAQSNNRKKSIPWYPDMDPNKDLGGKKASGETALLKGASDRAEKMKENSGIQKLRNKIQVVAAHDKKIHHPKHARAASLQMIKDLAMAQHKPSDPESLRGLGDTAGWKGRAV